jgi:hypothetical protein
MMMVRHRNPLALSPPHFYRALHANLPQHWHPARLHLSSHSRHHAASFQRKTARFRRLSFAIWPTFWQVAAALPLFLFEYFTRKNHPSSMSWQNVTMNTGIIALISGCLFGLATYIYLVAAEKAGAVNFMLAL